MEHSIVTNGNLWHSCVKVREAIELPFWVVISLGSGIGVLDGVHILQEEGEVFEGWVLLICWFDWSF